MQKSPKAQTIGLLKQAKEILIVGPKKWDADAAAGVIALHTVLKKCGKTSIAIAPDEMPRQLRFLLGSDSVAQTLGSGNDFVISIATKSSKIKNVHATEHEGIVDLVMQTDGIIDPSDIHFKQYTEHFDLIVTLGADSLEDCGKFFQEHAQLFTETPLINISVSATNEFFGRVNYVDASASAVCELLMEIIHTESDFEKCLNDELSTVILAGILSATDSFLAPNTSSRSLEIAAELQSRGADQSEVIEHLFKQKSFANLRTLGRLLGNLQLDQTHQMAWTNVTTSDFELTDTSPNDLDNWSTQLLRHVNGTDIVALFIEQKDDALLQIRTGNELDVSTLEDMFEGTVEKVDYGFDLLIKGKSVPEIQSHALRIIADWQEHRLHIEKQDIKKITLEELALPPEGDDVVAPTTTKKSVPAPKAPETLPFEVPIQK